MAIACYSLAQNLGEAEKQGYRQMIHIQSPYNVEERRLSYQITRWHNSGPRGLEEPCQNSQPYAALGFVVG